MRRPQTPFIVHFDGNQTSLKKSQITFNNFTERSYQEEKEPRSTRPLSGSKVYESKLYHYNMRNPLKSSEVGKSRVHVNFVNPINSPQKSLPMHEKYHRSSFNFFSPTPITFENKEVRTDRKVREAEEKPLGKINFSYERSDKKMTHEPNTHQNRVNKNVDVNAWKYEEMINKKRAIAQNSPI